MGTPSPEIRFEKPFRPARVEVRKPSFKEHQGRPLSEPQAKKEVREAFKHEVIDPKVKDYKLDKEAKLRQKGLIPHPKALELEAREAVKPYEQFYQANEIKLVRAYQQRAVYLDAPTFVRHTFTGLDALTRYTLEMSFDSRPIYQAIQFGPVLLRLASEIKDQSQLQVLTNLGEATTHRSTSLSQLYLTSAFIAASLTQKEPEAVKALSEEAGFNCFLAGLQVMLATYEQQLERIAASAAEANAAHALTVRKLAERAEDERLTATILDISRARQRVAARRAQLLQPKSRIIIEIVGDRLAMRIEENQPSGIKLIDLGQLVERLIKAGQEAEQEQRLKVTPFLIAANL